MGTSCYRRMNGAQCKTMLEENLMEGARPERFTFQQENCNENMTRAITDWFRLCAFKWWKAGPKSNRGTLAILENWFATPFRKSVEKTPFSFFYLAFNKPPYKYVSFITTCEKCSSCIAIFTRQCTVHVYNNLYNLNLFAISDITLPFTCLGTGR